MNGVAQQCQTLTKVSDHCEFDPTHSFKQHSRTLTVDVEPVNSHASRNIRSGNGLKIAKQRLLIEFGVIDSGRPCSIVYADTYIHLESPPEMQEHRRVSELAGAETEIERANG